MLFANNKVLLIKRKNDPFKCKWALPGGFVDEHESLDNAVERELKEETGLENIRLKQFGTFGDPGRDPRGHTVSIVYIGYLNTEAHVTGQDDALEAAWHPLNKLPNLAFDHHEIIARAISTCENLSKTPS